MPSRNRWLVMHPISNNWKSPVWSNRTRPVSSRSNRSSCHLRRQHKGLSVHEAAASSIHRTFATLTRFARKPVTKSERCELCSVELPGEHDHLIEPASRRLLCACQGCALLFEGAAKTKYRRVPRDMRS